MSLSAEQRHLMRYWNALGRFIHDFTAVEIQLQQLLWTEAGVSGPTAKAVFSGVRTDQARSYIRRIYDANGRNIPANLEDCLSQLTVINKVRNDIVHLGARFDETSRLVVTNKDITHVAAGTRETPISAEIIDAMASDLRHIEDVLWIHVELGHNPQEDHVPQTWQYKPPQPENERHTQGRAQKSKKRRSAS